MLEKKKDYHAWLYLAIPIILLSIFTFYPLIKTFIISFDKGYNSSLDKMAFDIGLFNFKKLFQHPSFPTTLKNTMLIVFITVPVSTLLALLIAVGLNSIKALQKVFQTIFFMPYVTNTIAIGMVFAVLFDKQTGLINLLLAINRDWIGMGATDASKRFVLHTYIIWNALPFKILIFIGGLQSISKQYYDAAKVDSTPKWRVFTRITVPLLSPMISYVLITSFIGSFKSYDAVIGVFKGSFAETRDMQTIVGFIYEMVAVPENYQYGAAAAVVLFAIIMIFTVFNLYISKKRVHY